MNTVSQKPRDRTRLTCRDCIQLERFVALCEAHALEMESPVEGSLHLVVYVLGSAVFMVGLVAVVLWLAW